MIVQCPKCSQSIPIDRSSPEELVHCASCGATLRVKLPERSPSPTTQQPATRVQARPATPRRDPAGTHLTQTAAQSVSDSSSHYSPPAHARPQQSSGVDPRAVWITAGIVGSVAALAVCGFLGFWLFGMASQHMDQLLPQFGDISGTNANSFATEPSTLRADLENFQVSGVAVSAQQLSALADRMKHEFKRLSGYDAIESVKVAFGISKKVLAETDDPELTRSAWHLAQAAYDQLFRACVDVQQFTQDRNYKLMGDFLERLASLGDRSQTYETSRGLVETLNSETTSRGYELAQAISASVLGQGKSHVNFSSDRAQWSCAVWITRDFIEVTCCSPKTVGIATELVLLCENMEHVADRAAQYRDAYVRTQGSPGNIGSLASNKPDEPLPAITADTPWGLTANNLFVPNSKTSSTIRALFPEAKWRLKEKTDGGQGYSTYTTNCSINGDQVALQFQCGGYEKGLRFYIHVDNEAEFLERLKPYKIRKLDQARRWITIELNEPKRLASAK